MASATVAFVFDLAMTSFARMVARASLSASRVSSVWIVVSASLASFSSMTEILLKSGKLLTLVSEYNYYYMKLGTHHTAASRAKLSDFRKGKSLTPAHREAISVALKGKSKTVAHRKAIGRGVHEAAQRGREATQALRTALKSGSA